MANDRDLGLHADISRRDFIQASALGTGAFLAPSAKANVSSNYPPMKTGLRGSHVGSFENAHALVTGQDLLRGAANTNEEYDLIVVGAGISGLSAAYFYRQEHPDARILILDNHDDFGGHAKRNEFNVDGKPVLGYGGSQSLESPGDYSPVAIKLLTELSVDTDFFYDAFDQDFYKRHKLTSGVYFDKATYGREEFVAAPFMLDAPLMGFDPREQDAKEVIDKMPLSDASKRELISLITQSEDKLADVGLTDVPDYLSGKSYEAFITDDVGIQSQELIKLLRRYSTGYFGGGTDQIPALYALGFGLPGIKKTGVWGVEWLKTMASSMVEPYIFHFPDGNASIARLLVRSLIPELSSSRKPSDVLLKRFDYNLLDQSNHAVRIRLESTAVRVNNIDSGVEVFYRTAGQTHRVSAKKSILACYNAMVPFLCPDLPRGQRAALSELVKIPLVYTNVVLRNWHALKKAHAGFVYTPSSFHSYFMVDFPVSFPGYQFSESPDDPLVLHFSEALIEPGLPPRAQSRAGRGRLLATPFTTIERDVRQTLAGTLGAHGFDPGSDIAAITVNRWPHGYAYTYNPLFDSEYDEGEAPHERGRIPFGNIAIANSDAGARAYLDEAIDQAHRAVSEVA
ncbi:MAG: FAD-dependent oxidoreductase [Pseudomonadales bacterium]|nr:FAD-dependent oxidoreductase [Pseudomonadales bacterium]